MASIREVRKALVPAVIVRAVRDIAGVGSLLSPAGRARESRVRYLATLKAQVAAKQQEVLPSRGMDEKLKQASTDIETFYKERFPTQNSSVSEELGKLAAARD